MKAASIFIFPVIAVLLMGSMYVYGEYYRSGEVVFPNPLDFPIAAQVQNDKAPSNPAVIQPEPSTVQLEAALKIGPYAGFISDLANSYEHEGRFNDAIPMYQRALEKNGNLAQAHCNLAYALLRMGKVDDAIGELISALQIDPQVVNGKRDLFIALKSRGIDPNSPPAGGNYPFDLQKALALLRASQPTIPVGG